MNGTLCSQNDLHRVFLCPNSIVLRMRCILNKNKCLTKLRKSTVLHLKTQNEGHIVRPSSGFSGAYSTPVEMIKALSYLMQIVGILYIFCDISRLAAKRPTNFTERICCNGGIISHACDRSISQSSHLFQTIEADPSFL